MNNIVLIFLGGGLGSLARYGISELVRLNFRSAFPLATFCSNVLSCIILAVVVLMLGNREEQTLRNFLLVGLCGGFSTFSTFSFETVELMRSGNFLFAMLNILLSIAVCITLIYFITKQS
jgi:CrcB protein